MHTKYGTSKEWVIFFIIIGWFHWPHANSLSEKFGLSSDRNDVLEWTDSFQPPMQSCPEEPLGHTLDESKSYHSQHIPRQCHLKIAKSILEKADSRGDYEHALFHQLLSGRGVDYYLAYPFVKPEWRPFIQSDKDRISYNVVKNNVESFADDIYQSEPRGLRIEVDYLDSVYLMEESEVITRREKILPLIIAAIILWFVHFFIDNGGRIVKAIRRMKLKKI